MAKPSKPVKFKKGDTVLVSAAIGWYFYIGRIVEVPSLKGSVYLVQSSDFDPEHLRCVYRSRLTLLELTDFEKELYGV